MILCAQTNFVKFLEQVLEVLKEVEIDKTECSILLESIQKQQLVIPVVGNFSAGKSTLLNRVINLFKESIDKVFDRVSAFTWEKYKEENDDEENDEENYREFEEIKKMVLYFRDCWMFVVEQLDGKSSQTELQKYKGFVSRNNKLLQSEFSMKNLLTLRQFKDTYREWYSKLRQLNEAKEVVSELRDYWLQELPPSAKDWISYCSTLLTLDYSLENLQKLRRFKDNFKKDYQKCKRSR